MAVIPDDLDEFSDNLWEQLYKLAMSDYSTREVIKKMFKLKNDDSITIDIYKNYLREIRRMNTKS